MAVGDFVIVGAMPAITAHPRPLVIGRVSLEVAGPPPLSNVQWFNGKRTTAVDQRVLAKLHPPSAELSALIGKWAQLVRWNAPSIAADGDAPKSPGAAGIIHSAFGVSPYDAADPAQFMVFMSMMNGRVPWLALPIENDAGVTQLATSTQRRNV